MIWLARQWRVLNVPAVVVVLLGVTGDGGVAQLAVAPVIDLSVHEGGTRRPDLCLRIALGSEASSECSDLRVSHALPAVRTLNRDRVPVLTYHSHHAAPFVVVPVHITLPPSGGVPTEVAVKLSSGGITLAEGRWSGSGWTAGATRRVTLGFETSAATGLYGYDIEVVNWYGAVPYATTGTGQYTVVNRAGSEFGAGWWLAGLENLLHLGEARLLWVGGDGSTRLYEPTVPNEWYDWVAQLPDRSPDTLRLRSPGGVPQYTRTLRDGTRVIFNEDRRHVQTISRTGHVTNFDYSHPNGYLASITVPVQTGTGPTYAFTYQHAGGTRLSHVQAPGGRAVGVAVTSGRLTSLTDPDQHSVHFGYASSGRLTSRTDRRGTVTTFSYDAAQRLTGSVVDPAGLNLVTGIVAAESRGYGAGPTPAASVSPADAYTLLDGPRTDVLDHTAFWIDRYGSPSMISNALAQTTTLVRGDARFPALVTQVVHANGFTQTAAYDARGNVTQQTDLNPYGDGRNAITQYEWDTACPDFPSRIIAPEGEITEFGYDAQCQRTWQQTGGSVHRVNYAYTGGLLDSLTEPGMPAQTFTYNALGQITQQRTPRGFLTLHYPDAIGRDTLVITPIDTVSALNASQLLTQGIRQRIVYDVMSRPSVSVSTTPAMPNCGSFCQNAPADTLQIQYYYDPEGAPTGVMRLSGMSGAGTGYAYDAAGRRTGEGSDNTEQGFSLDPAGNVVAHTRGNGQTITMKYDALNRLTERAVPAAQHTQSTCMPFAPVCPYVFPLYPNGPNGSLLVPADTQRYSYDGMGNLIEARNRDAVVRRGYHPNGQVRADTQRIRAYTLEPHAPGAYDQHVYALAYVYDTNGRRTAITYPANLTGSTPWTAHAAYRTWDTGALHTVTAPSGHVFGFQYDAAGRDTQRMFPGGTEVRGFDADGQLRTRSQSTTVLGTFRSDSYRYDARGRVVEALGGSQHTARHWYSGLGALVGTDYFGVGSDHIEEFRVDGLGNVLATRSSRNGNPASPFHTHTYWGAQLATIERDDYTGPQPQVGAQSEELFNEYDAGNVIFMGTTRRVFSGEGIWEPVHQVASRSFWSADERLIAHQRYSGGYGGGNTEGAYEEYRYDALGRRILVRTRRDGLCSGHTACHGAITRFVWDGAVLLFELRAPGAHSVTGSALEATTGTAPYYGRVAYVHGPELDKPLAVIRGTDPAGFIVPHLNWRGLYDRATTATGAHFTAAIDWPGLTHRSYHSQDLDSKPEGAWYGSLILDQKDATGLLYRRNRYYDPASGRFTQEDPIGLAGGINLYGYANGDPINFSDPFGLCPFPLSNCFQQVANWGAARGGAIGAAALNVGAFGAAFFETGSAVGNFLSPSTCENGVCHAMGPPVGPGGGARGFMNNRVLQSTKIRGGATVAVDAEIGGSGLGNINIHIQGQGKTILNNPDDISKLPRNIRNNPQVQDAIERGWSWLNKVLNQ